MAGQIQLNSTTFATESGGTVTVSNVDSATNRTNLGLGSMATQNANAVALTGGSLTGTEIDLKSSGTTIYKSDGSTALMSESGGTVTMGNVLLGSSVVNDNYGYAQVKLTGDVGTQGFITFNTIVGDSNFTISSELITLPYSGIYHIVFSGTGTITGNTPERTFSIGLYTGASGLLSTARDQLNYLDTGTSFGNACLSYVGSFSASDTIKFNFSSDSGASVDLQSTSHVSLVLVRRTA